MAGYWTNVFKRAVELIKANPKLDGDTAYKMARNDVDASNPQSALELSAPEDLKLTPR